jgi:predicted permease
MKIRFPVFDNNPTLISGTVVFTTLFSAIIMATWVLSELIPLIFENFTPTQVIPTFFFGMLIIMFLLGYIKVERK